MSSTTTTTQIATKPSKTSIKHLSPKASTSSLPAPQKLITHQDSLSSSKSASIITNVVPASNCLSPQASFSRDDARGALMTAILNSIEGFSICNDWQNVSLETIHMVSNIHKDKWETLHIE